MLTKNLFTILSLTGLSVMMTSAAQDEASFEAGHGALQRWDAAGIAATPLWVQIWLGFLGICLLSSLFFVRRHQIPRWVLGGIILSIPLTPIIARSLGFPFLSGAIAIGHLVFWMPAFLMLAFQRPFLDDQHSTPYRVWSAAMLGAYAFSFVFDIRDSLIYIGYFMA